MTSHDMFEVASTLSDSAVVLWILVSFTASLIRMTGRTPPALIGAVFHELRPFYLPAVAVMYLSDSVLHDPSAGWRIFNLVMDVVNWFVYKDSFGDDDRWKRRKARLVEKVSQVGGRLVVEPAGAES